jgi:heat shock protein HspQ
MTPFEPFGRSSSVMARAIHIPEARFGIGEVVRHKIFDFRGVIFDVDPEFANSEEWYESIPEALRPSREQPFYHLLAENSESSYVAYVSQQNLVRDDSEEPLDNPAIAAMFEQVEGGYRLRDQVRH